MTTLAPDQNAQNARIRTRRSSHRERADRRIGSGRSGASRTEVRDTAAVVAASPAGGLKQSPVGVWTWRPLGRKQRNAHFELVIARIAAHAPDLSRSGVPLSAVCVS